MSAYDSEAFQMEQEGAFPTELDTITVEPDWGGLRRWLLEAVFPTDPVTARKIAAEMGSEAPVFPGDEVHPEA